MLLVQPRCSYLTTVDVQWRDVDYAAHYYALMCKGDAEKLAKLKTTSRLLPIGPNDAQESVPKTAIGQGRVRAHFGRWAAGVIRGWGFDHPVIVPIPNSHAIVGVDQFPTITIANAIATGFGQDASVEAAIRFQMAMPKSHKGGCRDAEAIARNMVVRQGFNADQIVLVDDLVTTGAHMKAARKALTKLGMNPERAVVCGRGADFQADDPFQIASENLDDALDFDDIFEDLLAGRTG